MKKRKRKHRNCEINRLSGRLVISNYGREGKKCWFRQLGWFVFRRGNWRQTVRLRSFGRKLSVIWRAGSPVIHRGYRFYLFSVFLLPSLSFFFSGLFLFLFFVRAHSSRIFLRLRAGKETLTGATFRIYSGPFFLPSVGLVHAPLRKKGSPRRNRELWNYLKYREAFFCCSWNVSVKGDFKPRCTTWRRLKSSLKLTVRLSTKYLGWN